MNMSAPFISLHQKKYIYIYLWGNSRLFACPMWNDKQKNDGESVQSKHMTLKEKKTGQVDIRLWFFPGAT